MCVFDMFYTEAAVTLWFSNSTVHLPNIWKWSDSFQSFECILKKGWITCVMFDCEYLTFAVTQTCLTQKALKLLILHLILKKNEIKILNII